MQVPHTGNSIEKRQNKKYNSQVEDFLWRSPLPQDSDDPIKQILQCCRRKEIEKI
jgi:hypothetical protein